MSERSGHDYSIEESFNLTVPAPALMRGLHLRLAEGRSLAYATADSRILFKDPSVDEPGFSAAVVDRDVMRSFLDAEGLEIVWVVTGEKSAHGGRRHGNGWGGMLNYRGIYRFDGDLILWPTGSCPETGPWLEQLTSFGPSVKIYAVSFRMRCDINEVISINNGLRF